ncbi:MAG: hypothetical protein HQM10_11055 [Candidatus Riflebacteria bacterium]|nr:hypothetical protein [Candidatus Riflebacteria bacterium]
MLSTNDVQNFVFDLKDSTKPRSVNFYFDHYRGETIFRAVVYLANRGCEWSIKTGGCTMCGTKNTALRREINDEDFYAQLAVAEDLIKKFNDSHDYKLTSFHVYNDGLFFNDAEVTPNVRQRIFELAKSLGFKKLVVETNGIDVMKDNRTTDYLGKAIKFLAPVELEVTLGVESANAQVRSLYNKPDSLEEMRSSLQIIRDKGGISKGYVLVKGPLMTEEEAYLDCVNTINKLKEWSNGERFRVELQPVCLLPNTLHEFLIARGKNDPYYWEPPLMSTLFRILSNFPEMTEDLYTALFARIDKDSSWDFWQNRPHDDQATTFKLYQQLVQYYLHRKPEYVTAALEIVNNSLWEERKKQVLPHPLEIRVSVVKKLISLSKKENIHLSDYLKKYIGCNDNMNFIDACLKHFDKINAAELA